MVRCKKTPEDFVKIDFGWDALELVFMIQSHSYDFGCCTDNNEVDRKLKDDRIQYCFDICEKMSNDQWQEREYGNRIYRSVSNFYRVPNALDLPDGCLYSKQLPSSNFKDHHHFCCGPTSKQVIPSFPSNTTRLYRIFLKPDAEALFLQRAIDTIVRKSYLKRLFNEGVIREPYEIIILGKDIDRIERVEET